MHIFSEPLEIHANRFMDNGYLWLQKIVTSDFLSLVRSQVPELLAASSGQYDIPGKKHQFIFPISDYFPFESEIRKPIAEMMGIEARQLTMSERHINAYLATAQTANTVHLDRRASEINLGIPINIQEASYLVLYPDCEITPNRYDSVAEWRSHLAKGEFPEELIKELEPVKIYDQPGDAVVFRGSAIPHERYRPAGCTVLYFKFNQLGLDPLGEEIR